MTNHPNRKPITHQQMLENHTDFYPASRSFSTKALQPTGVVAIAGSLNVVSLWMCVEWDHQKVLLGYHWQPPVGGARGRAGLESWFNCNRLVQVTLGSHIEREMMYVDPIDTTLQDHNFILKTARECQAILDDDSLDREGKVLAIEQKLKSETDATTS